MNCPWREGGEWDRLVTNSILVMVIYTIGHAASWVAIDLTTWMTEDWRKLATTAGVYLLGVALSMIVYFLVHVAVEPDRPIDTRVGASQKDMRSANASEPEEITDTSS